MAKGQRSSSSKAVARLKARPHGRKATRFLPHPNGFGSNVWHQFSLDMTTASNIAAQAFDDNTSSFLTPGIVNNFAKSRVTSLSLEWIPAIGPNNTDAAARISAALYKGGEIMKTVVNKSIANVVADIKTSNTLQCCNAWERTTFHFAVPGKWVDTNSTFNTATATAEEYARTMSFVVMTSAESASAAATLGKFLIRTTYEVGGPLTGTVDT